MYPTEFRPRREIKAFGPLAVFGVRIVYYQICLQCQDRALTSPNIGCVVHSDGAVLENTEKSV